MAGAASLAHAGCRGDVLQALLARDLAHAEVEDGFGRIFLAVGADILPAGPAQPTLEDVAAAIAATEAAWSRGEIALQSWPRGRCSGRRVAAVPAVQTIFRVARSFEDVVTGGGSGAGELGLEGPVDPDVFRTVLEGRVPDGSGRQLGRKGKDGEIAHRPGRDLTLSAPKSVSIAALVGGDGRVVDAHDRAVTRTLAWFEKNVAETRMKDPETGRVVRTGDQKTVVATFRHDTSRNLDPALHTHSVIANMMKGADGKWRSMSNERLYESKMLLGAMYRSELAAGLSRVGYGIEKTHADGRFEIAGVSR